MTFQSVLITGTDTGVGKTTVACGIAAALRRRGLQVGVYKPAETGCARGAGGNLLPADAMRLKFFSGCTLGVDALCCYTFEPPLAPAVAAHDTGVQIELERLVHDHDRVAAPHDITLVEGAGGLLVPLAPGVTFAELAVRLRLPVVVVVASRLGAINHALLTMRYARGIGLHVLGYVVNFLTDAPDRAAQTNVAVLADWLGPPLGVVPSLGELRETDTDRDRLAALFAERLRLDHLLLRAAVTPTACET